MPTSPRPLRPPRPTVVDASVDGPVAVRAASRGFSVLAIGGAVQPLVGAASAPVGYVWLVLVAVAAFVVSAWTADGSAVPVRQGVAGALGSYALVLPLVYLATGSVDPEQVGFTALTAVGVGGAVGWLRGARRRD